MTDVGKKSFLFRWSAGYGMLPVLVALCALFSILTLKEQVPTGAAGAIEIAHRLEKIPLDGHRLLLITSAGRDDKEFAQSVVATAQQQGWPIDTISGDPAEVRNALSRLDSAKYTIVTTTLSHPMVERLREQFAWLQDAQIESPASSRWPTFLLAENLRNVANQITVIAIIAIGMTMVIVAGGIDLSVGSLVALSAVVITYVLQSFGGVAASTSSVLVAALLALVVCALIGAFSGMMITAFRIPSFIATLAMMQVAAGLAYIVSEGKPIYQVPEGFVWLGRGVDPLLGIPVAVLLMFGLYAAAWVVMERSVFGRHIYAVGGNPEAARLAGIRVGKVQLLVFTFCGLLAGLGGILMSSQLKSGAPTYGITYELYVIAAVVVGGTSLTGGEGKVLGTLIGAFIIGVIQNGMNLTNIESYTQKVVLGLVILAAVLFDRLKQRGFGRRSKAVMS